MEIMIRDRYGETWAGREDLARDWGSEVADIVWGDLLGSYHPVRTLVEEDGVPRRDPDGTPVGWDDLIPMTRWSLLIADCQEIEQDIAWGEGMDQKLKEIKKREERGW